MVRDPMTPPNDASRVEARLPVENMTLSSARGVLPRSQLEAVDQLPVAVVFQVMFVRGAKFQPVLLPLFIELVALIGAAFMLFESFTST